MELKNIIYLYLGCEAMLTNPSYHAVHELGLSADRKFTLSGKLIDYFSHETTKAEIKPIIRRLSSMTDKEIEHIGISLKAGTWNAQDLSYLQDGAFSVNHVTPKVFLYLLKQGFDLFNLIDSGQAIEKVNQ